MTMDDLTVEKIIEIHDEVIANYEGTPGILSHGTLDYLVYRLNRLKHVVRRAALVMHSIGSQHPFIDGNKRTALIVAENILGKEGLYLALDDEQIVDFMLGIASYQFGLDNIEQWIQNHAEPLEK
jgi:death on curing protein